LLLANQGEAMILAGAPRVGNLNMSLQVQPVPSLPNDIAQVVRQILPASHALVVVGDRLSDFVSDASFADLYPAEGRPALSPALLAMVTLLQYWEFLSDRQAAHMVISRLDWKYALHLGLTYAGFDHSVLCEFRQRLIAHDAQRRVFDQLLVALRAAGLLKGKHMQRTDSLAVLAAVRALSRLELALETLRLALVELEVSDSTWLKTAVPSSWAEQYGSWTQQERLVHSKGEAGRAEAERLLQQAGADGQWLLDKLAAPGTPAALAAAEPARLLRRVWGQQFETVAGRVQPRARVDSCGAELIHTPHDPDVRYGEHGSHGWEGYLLQWTETAAPEAPRLITDVATTPAGRRDCQQLDDIQARLAERDLLPDVHLSDMGYVTGETLAGSAARGVQLVGPIQPDSSLQARTPGGLTLEQFEIDWAQHQARCPGGQTATTWSESQNDYGAPVVHIRFAAAGCRVCPLQPACMPKGPVSRHGRSLKVAATHPLVRQRRQAQTTPAFRQAYRKRAGVEASLSNAVRQHGARWARYRGLFKTRLQHLWLASAINLKRAVAWLIGRRPRTERKAGLRTLAAAPS
jgi:transposase